MADRDHVEDFSAPGCCKNTWKNNKLCLTMLMVLLLVLLIVGVVLAIVFTSPGRESEGSEGEASSVEPIATTTEPITTTTEPITKTTETIITTTGAPKKERKVFAHYYLSATRQYDRNGDAEGEFRRDIFYARKAKLDGFILNIAGGEWQEKRLEDMYRAAGLRDIELFINLDLSSPMYQDPNNIISVFKRIWNMTSQFTVDGRPVLGVHHGEELIFGEINRTMGWTKHIIEPLKNQNIPIYFMPYWPSVEIENLFDENFVDGYQSFEAWPFDYDAVRYDSENGYIEHAHRVNKKVISAVSPGYFSHSIEKNVVYRSEDTWHLRWEQLINDDADFAQVVSWNGFHESHAVGPINPLSSVDEYPWYEKMSNEAFKKMLPYYVDWFKTRKQPPLTENVIYFYHRPHSLYVCEALNDSIPKPLNYKQVMDVLVIHSFIRDAGNYDARITVNGEPIKGKESFVLKGGEIIHVLVPFRDSVGKVELIVSQEGIELARTPRDNPTEIIAPNKLQKWNFNFDSRVITFLLDRH